MKKTIHPTLLPYLTLGLSGLGMLLRFWLFADGVDDRGLLKSTHPAAILVWILTVVTLAGLFLLTRQLRGQGRHRNNFPASVPGAVGCGLAAAAIFLTAMATLMDHPDPLTAVSGMLGILAVPCLLLAAFGRFQGSQVTFLLHAVVSVYFTIHMMSSYRHWSAEPQLQEYIFQLLANLGLMLTAYHRAAFDVRMGKRRSYAFFNLATVFLCCLAIPGSSQKLYFFAMALWLITNLCSLKDLPQRAPRSAQPPQANEAPAADGAPRQEEL